jgi:hypothetical protein
VRDASLDYVTIPNPYPFNQKEMLGVQKEGQTRSFPSSSRLDPECLGAQQEGHVVS